MVTIISSYTVIPSEPTPNHPLMLSESDQIVPWTHGPSIYIYKPKHNNDNSAIPPVIIDGMRDSLGNILVHFFPLAGRLRWIEGGHERLEVDCNAMGVKLLEAESTKLLAEYGGFEPNETIKELIPKVDYNKPIEEVPLLLVQLTRFKCGGLSIGVAMSSVIADGTAAVHFINSWAKLARGDTLVEDEMPFLDRTVLKSSEPTLLEPPRFDHQEFKPLPLLLGCYDDMEERKKETSVAMLKLTREQVEKLKSDANAYVRMEQPPMTLNFPSLDKKTDANANSEIKQPPLTLDFPSSDKNIDVNTNSGMEQLPLTLNFSSLDKKNDANETMKGETLGQRSSRPHSRYEAIAAKVWQSATKARQGDSLQPSAVRIVADIRNRLKPPLPRNYFGNAIIRTVTPTCLSGDIISGPLGYVTQKIREAIDILTDEYIRSQLDFVKSQEHVDWLRGSFHTLGCMHAQFLGNPNLHIVSWMSMPVYGADFGRGKPVYLGPGAMSADGKAFIIPSPDEDGSLIVAIRLQTAHMEAFQKFFYEGI